MSAPASNPLTQALRVVRGAFLVVALFSLFINIAALVVPLYMMQVYDRVLTSRSTETLVALTTLALGLLAIVAFVEVARTRILVRIGAELDEKLGEPLFGNAVEQRASGQQDGASQPLRDLETLRMFMTGAGVLALLDAPWTPIYLAIIFLLHPLLGLVATLGAVVIFILAVLSEVSIRSPMRASGAATRWSNELIEIFARSSHSIRVMGMLGRMELLWRSHRRDGVAMQAVASDRLGILQAVAKSARLALQVAILGVGAWLVINGAATGGVMIAASIIMGRALAPVEAALGHWRGVVNARAAYRRLLGVLEHVHSGKGHMPLPAPEGRLELTNVGLRRAEGAPPVLSAVSFTIAAGETLALIGPSGAGKSTLARLLVGVSRPTLGSVRLDGAEVSQWPQEELGPFLGYLPQEVELLGGTVAQNICRFGNANPAAVVEAARLVGAHDMILRLPHGYETVIEEGGRNLSGGQCQRLGLARALFGDPRLIVLDEPDANLDSEGEATLRNALASLKQRKRTVVVITHKPALLSVADKLMVLGDGRVQCFGGAASVMAELARRSGNGHRIEPGGARPNRPAAKMTGKRDAKVRVTS